VLFENLVKRPIRDIDVLFLEGTMLHRNNDLFPDETAVEKAIFQTIQQQKNISLLLSSSQNIDRVVSAYCIIDMAQATKDPEELADIISREWLAGSLRMRQPFIARISADGSLTVREIED
jgi:hypothetical protein